MHHDASPEAEARIAQAKRNAHSRLSLLGLNLSVLPESLAELTELTHLDLGRNALTELPEWLGRLTRLVHLDFSVNRIQRLPRSVGNLTQLKYLVGSSNQLIALPDEIGNLTQLDSLLLADNQLTELPAVGRLTKLRIADLGHNQLVALPDTMTQLPLLQRLDLSTNKLAELPRDLGQLVSLEQIYVDRNQLTVLPETLGQLVNLRYLFAFTNKLTALPGSLAELTRLRHLDLSDNQLTELPPAINRFTQLEALNLSGNQLTRLPAALRKLHNLTDLNLRGNPGLGLPEEALGAERSWDAEAEKSPREILDYYFRIRPPQGKSEHGGGRPLLEARIIIIGDGAAGKTSLVRQLLHGLPAQRDEASTRDVVIARWNVAVNKASVQVHVWDFGGQRQMHAAHPYFFTNRTLYLIVAEARKDQQDRVDYWLKMVAKYGDTARALVVVNKADLHNMALDRPKLLYRFSKNLPEDCTAAFFSTSCADGRGIAQLRHAIHRELENTPQVWALWPEEWFRVKESLHELREPKAVPPEWLKPLLTLFGSKLGDGTSGAETLNFDTWRAICQLCGISDEKDRDNLLESLGHLGQVVCFPRDAHLCQLGVLNPDWVTRGMYPLLVENRLAEKGGMLTMEDLVDLLPPDRYPKERHHWLIQLMKAFELLFEDSDGRLLLPGQLPVNCRSIHPIGLSRKSGPTGKPSTSNCATMPSFRKGSFPNSSCAAAGKRAVPANGGAMALP